MPKKNKEKGVALARQEEDTPQAVNDNLSDISILPQKTLINQGSTDENSDKTMENTEVMDTGEVDTVSVGGTRQDDTLDEDDEDLEETIASRAGLRYNIQSNNDQDTNDILRQAIIEISENTPFSIHDLMNRERAVALKESILTEVNMTIDVINANLQPSDKLKKFKALNEAGLAQIIVCTGDVKLLKRTDKNDKATYTISYYSHVGHNAGIWYSDESDGQDILRNICSNFSVGQKLARNIADELKSNADIKVIKEKELPYLVPCANGMLDLSQVKTDFTDYIHYTATGFDFTPYTLVDGEENPEYIRRYGNLVYTWKLRTKWNPNAANKTFCCSDGYEWSVDKHFTDAFKDNIKCIRLILEQLNFLIRGKRGDYTIFYGDGSDVSKGGGLKSTTASMQAYVLGLEHVLMRDIDELVDKDFGLAGIMGKKLLLGMETNADNQEIKGGKTAKKIMRGEQVSVNAKFKAYMEYAYKGMWIQCFNGIFNVAAKESAFYRKLLVLPFSSVFVDQDGNQISRDEIQDKFIKTAAVREYLLLLAASLGAIKHYDTECIKEAQVGVKDAQIRASSVMTFMEDVAPTFVGDNIPFPALYTAYKFGWCPQNGHNSANRGNFINGVKRWLQLTGSTEWVVLPADSYRLPADAPPEPFLAEYASGSKWVEYGNDGEWSHVYVGGASKGCAVGNQKPSPIRGCMLHRIRNDEEDILPESRGLPIDEALTEYAQFFTAWFYYYSGSIARGEMQETDCPTFKQWSEAGKAKPVYRHVWDASTGADTVLVEEFVPTEAANVIAEQEQQTAS